MGIIKLLEERKEAPVDISQGFVSSFNATETAKRTRKKELEDARLKSDYEIRNKQAEEYIQVKKEREALASESPEALMQGFTSMIGAKQQATAGTEGAPMTGAPGQPPPAAPVAPAPDLNPATGQPAAPGRKWVSRTEFTQGSLSDRARMGSEAQKDIANRRGQATVSAAKIRSAAARGSSGKDILDYNLKQQQQKQDEIDTLAKDRLFMLKAQPPVEGEQPTPEYLKLNQKERELQQLQKESARMMDSGFAELTSKELQDPVTSERMANHIKGVSDSNKEDEGY